MFGKRHNNHFVGFWYERYELAWGIPNFWWLQRWIARMRKTKLTSNFKVITYRNTWRNSFFCSRNVIPKKKREIWGERASQRAVYGGRGTSEPTHNSSRPKTIKYPLFLEEASGGQPCQPSHRESLEHLSFSITLFCLFRSQKLEIAKQLDFGLLNTIKKI